MAFPVWTVRSQAFNDFWEQYGIKNFERECDEGTARAIFMAGMLAATHFEDKIKAQMRAEIRKTLSASESVLYGRDE